MKSVVFDINENISFNEVKEYVLNSFSLEEIADLTKAPLEDVIDIINPNSNDVKEEYYDLITNLYNQLYESFVIKDDKFLLIADTHIGSEKQNLEFINWVYEYAYKNNFKYIIHVGDLIEGVCNPTRKKMEIPEQIDLLNSLMIISIFIT